MGGGVNPATTADSMMFRSSPGKTKPDPSSKSGYAVLGAELLRWGEYRNTPLEGVSLDSFLFCLFFLFSCCEGLLLVGALLRLLNSVLVGGCEMHQSRGMRCTRSEVETMLNLL